MILPLLMLAEGAALALPPTYDFRDWHFAASGRTCDFSLSANFYGIVLRHDPARPDVEVAFESPAVHVLPLNVAIPLKVDVNGKVQRATGERIGGKLVFRLDFAAAEPGLKRRGQVRIMLSDPSIRDTLLARYRLSGRDYERVFDSFDRCRAGREFSFARPRAGSGIAGKPQSASQTTG